jgi:hypothetical protein
LGFYLPLFFLVIMYVYAYSLRFLKEACNLITSWMVLPQYLHKCFISQTLTFKTWHLLYLPPALRNRNPTFCLQCIYVFCVDLRTNSDYFSLQHYLTGFYNRGRCLLCGTNWVFKLNSRSFVHKSLLCIILFLLLLLGMIYSFIWNSVCLLYEYFCIFLTAVLSV